METNVCTIAVHSSITYSNELLLEYKGTLMRYLPAQRPTDSDSVMCRMGQLDFRTIFSLVYELCSAICFASDVKIRLGDGLINHTVESAVFTSMNHRMNEPRVVPIGEVRPFIPYIALIRNDEQASLLRLFRHAMSADDAYSRLLFFWHTLVYPNQTETAAVAYINSNIARLPDHQVPHLEAIRGRPLFTSAPVNDLGSYIRQGIRHSIAHIVRDGNTYRSLEMDNIHEMRHVYSASVILQELCRLRLTEDFGIELGNDPTILRFHRAGIDTFSCAVPQFLESLE